MMKIAKSAQPLSWQKRRAFTLIEVLVGSAILALMLVFLLSTVSQASQVWRRSSNTIDAYQSAREAFDLITRKISEATLNTYWAYEYTTVGGELFPTAYRRESDLHFISGPNLAGLSQAIFFQTPDGNTADQQEFGGMNQLLNDYGFYLVHGNDRLWRPPPADALPASARYRLIQLNVPTEELGPNAGGGTGWFTTEIVEGAAGYASRNVPIGENIVAVAFWPRRAPLDEAARGPLPGGFAYDSRDGADSSPQPITANQLPPLVEVVMIAIDKQSATRLAAEYGDTEPPPVKTALANRLVNPDNLEDDLKRIGEQLTEAGIGYRVFRATVPVHASKWSETI